VPPDERFLQLFSYPVLLAAVVSRLEGPPCRALQAKLSTGEEIRGLKKRLNQGILRSRLEINNAFDTRCRVDVL
jgi:hypothetical protein